MSLLSPTAAAAYVALGKTIRAERPKLTMQNTLLLGTNNSKLPPVTRTIKMQVPIKLSRQQRRALERAR